MSQQAIDALNRIVTDLRSRFGSLTPSLTVTDNFGQKQR